jgi:transcriptional regulator with XRE-family HTH domain
LIDPERILEERRQGFRRRLIEAMRRKGLNQAELARRLRERGLKARTSTVNEWVRQGALPGGAHLMVLPEILDVTLDWLLLESTPSGGEASAVVAEVVEFAESLKARYGCPPTATGEAGESAVALVREARRAVERVEEMLTPQGPRRAQAP